MKDRYKGMSLKQRKLIETIKRNKLMQDESCTGYIKDKEGCEKCLLWGIETNTCAEAVKVYIESIKDPIEKMEFLFEVTN